MGKIHVLDEHLANQIAAGEVVERPASIVKELAENAIDAGATRIQIQLEEGGISLIRVSDNGEGMERDDAILAFTRHATSKIKRERDLFAIRTLGFRGEALPSIASVAKVSLTTAHDPDQLGVTIQIEGGELKGIEETARSQGTDVEVRHLFYNTPARLKYLKTVNTEVSQVADVVGRLALAHPNITFTLTHDQRELFHTSGDGKMLHVLHALYGRQVAGQLLHFTGENADFRIHGFVSRPEVTRSSRAYISIILNGRSVRSIPITQSLLHAYGTLLPNGRYPLGVVHIEMDPKIVDVNVHPAKLEVRLSKEKECCQLLEQAIHQAFQKERFVPVVNKAPDQAKVSSIQVQEELNWTQPSIRGEQAPVNRKLEARHSSNYPTPSAPSVDQVRESSDVKMDLLREIAPKRETDSSQWSERLPKRGVQIGAEVGVKDQGTQEEALQKLPPMLPLSQIHGTYIVAQTADGFYLLDQHAAHERIYYELFYQKLGETNHHQQPLLIPLTIECAPSEVGVVEFHLPYLQQWGLEMEPFGGGTFLVRAYPSWFPAGNVENLIHEVIDWLKEHGKVDTFRLRDASAKMMSCKAAIKANRHLRQDEMEELIQRLNSCENPFTCPHGRPIFVHFSTYELEKMFKRVM